MNKNIGSIIIKNGNKAYVRGDQNSQKTLPSLDRALLKLATHASVRIGEVASNKVLNAESR